MSNAAENVDKKALDKRSPKPTPTHPAWDDWFSNHKPARGDDDDALDGKVEYMGTNQILEQLNSICDDESYSDLKLYHVLKENGFKYLRPAPGGINLWMVIQKN